MSETSVDPDSGEFEQSLPSVGTQLRLAREAKGLSLAEAGQALKLGPRQVEALENGNWDALPGSTFIRGFVRNYARLVQVDPTLLMAQMDSVLEVKRPELALRESAHVAMPEPAGRSRRRDYAVASFGLLLVGLAALAYFFLPQDLSKMRDSVEAIVATYSRPAPPAGPVAPPAPQGEPVLPPGATVAQVMNPQSTANEPSPPPATAPEAAPGQQSAAVVAPEEKTEAPPSSVAPLRLSFTKESWVEIRDRRGNVVFSQRGSAGMERDVDGQAPFSIVIGYAPGVTLKYRGQNVDLAPFARGDVARLTLE